MEKIRTFVAIELPQEVITSLDELQADLRRRLQNMPIRWVKPQKIHLTLKFLGDVPADQIDAVAEALRAACVGVPPFEFELAGLGCFPTPRRPRVIWVGTEGDLTLLHQLRDAVEEHIAPLGYPTERRPFRPHLTLGRVKRASPGQARQIGAEITAAKVGTLAQVRVEEVSLMRSDLSPAGAKYTRLAVVRLQATE
jgi:2'-5' RNA ligase